MVETSLENQTIDLQKWFKDAIKAKLIKEIEYKTFEREGMTIEGGSKSELVFAKCNNDYQRVVIKKVSTEGSISSRKQKFIYEVGIKCIIFSCGFLK